MKFALLVIALALLVVHGCGGNRPASDAVGGPGQILLDGGEGTWFSHSRGDAFIVWHEPTGTGTVNWVVEIPVKWRIENLEYKGLALTIETKEHGDYKMPRGKLIDFISITYEREGHQIEDLWNQYKNTAQQGDAPEPATIADPASRPPLAPAR